MVKNYIQIQELKLKTKWKDIEKLNEKTFMKHTPLPYRAEGLLIESDHGNIGIVNIARASKEDAKHIVHCVNSHEKLVKQRDDLLELCKKAFETWKDDHGHMHKGIFQDNRQLIDDLYKAVSQLESEGVK